MQVNSFQTRSKGGNRSSRMEGRGSSPHTLQASMRGRSRRPIIHDDEFSAATAKPPSSDAGCSECLRVRRSCYSQRREQSRSGPLVLSGHARLVLFRPAVVRVVVAIDGRNTAQLWCNVRTAIMESISQFFGVSQDICSSQVFRHEVSRVLLTGDLAGTQIPPRIRSWIHKY